MPRTTPRSLAVFAAAAIGALALSSCASSSSSEETAPVEGGTLVYATGDAEPTCLDPHVGGNYPQALISTQQTARSPRGSPPSGRPAKTASPGTSRSRKMSRSLTARHSTLRRSRPTSSTCRIPRLSHPPGTSRLRRSTKSRLSMRRTFGSISQLPIPRFWSR